jgi:hypothetical protein
MSVRGTVRDAQRRLAVLDAAHNRALAKLDQAAARRAEVLAEHDRMIAVAEAEVERAVADMAAEIGADLTANLLDLDVVAVRRLAKASHPAGTGDIGTR